ncbi:hypothetical protein BGX31_006535 [Mortierella sp. GBA43]|nr:hypothetical protein BGX31_006535 [Mortierella sp. GBA43]
MSFVVDILRNNPRPMTMDIFTGPRAIRNVLNSIIDSRKNDSVKGVSPTNWPALTVSMDFGERGDMILGFPENSATPDISTNLPMANVSYYPKMISDYRWCFTTMAADTASQMRCMDRVIERSQCLEALRFGFTEPQDRIQLEKAKYLLGRYNKKAISLDMTGSFSNEAISEIANLCPTRHELPDLTEFRLRLSNNSILSSDSAQWIARMVSALSPLNTSLHTPVSILDTDEPLTEYTVEYAWQSLTEVWFSGLALQHEDWRSIIMALDFSILRRLSFQRSNCSLAEFRLLADCIPEVSNAVDWLRVDMKDSDFDSCLTKSEEVNALKKKAPHVVVVVHEPIVYL